MVESLVIQNTALESSGPCPVALAVGGKVEMADTEHTISEAPPVGILN